MYRLCHRVWLHSCGPSSQAADITGRSLIHPIRSSAQETLWLLGGECLLTGESPSPRQQWDPAKQQHGPYGKLPLRYQAAGPCIFGRSRPVGLEGGEATHTKERCVWVSHGCRNLLPQTRWLEQQKSVLSQAGGQRLPPRLWGRSRPASFSPSGAGARGAPGLVAAPLWSPPLPSPGCPPSVRVWSKFPPSYQATLMQ